MKREHGFSKLVGGLVAVGCILSSSPAKAEDAAGDLDLKCFATDAEGGHWSYANPAALDLMMPRTQKEVQKKITRWATQRPATLGRYCERLHRLVEGLIYETYDHSFNGMTAKELRAHLREASISDLSGMLEKPATWRDVISVGRDSIPHSERTTRPIECTDDNHCSGDLVCSPRGQCVKCTADDDCDDGNVCGRRNTCQPKPAEEETETTDDAASTPAAPTCPAGQHMSADKGCVADAPRPEPSAAPAAP